MGKGKREGGSKVDEGEVDVKLGDYFTEFGVAEVDRLFYGRQFRKANSTCCLPKVDRIYEAHRVVKFSPHPCTKPASQNDKVDRISGMPDDILQYIISFSTIREGAATSILSTRWRFLWTTSFSTLNFDIPNMLGYHYPDTIFEEEGKTIFINRISNFTRWVNQVLELRRASRLDALRVSFVLNNEFGSHIDKWIEFATAQGVSDIQLDFDFPKFRFPQSPIVYYLFPVQQVASSLKYLDLNNCNFRLSPDFTGFTSLVTLYLSDIYVTRPIVDNILSKCPLLEFLSLPYCRYPNRTSLKFAGQSLLLKHLHIGPVFGGNGIEIELHDVILVSIELEGCVSKLLIKSAPHLARLVLCRCTPILVLSNLPRLEMLFLTQLYEKSSMPQSVFSNLKRLVFLACFGTTNLLGVVYILEACHLLEKLELDMGVRKTDFDTETVNILNTICGSPHNNLKEIEMHGFRTYPGRIELAKYLLKIAIVLEKMKLYRTSREYNANGKWSLWSMYEGTANQAVSLKEACKMLQKVLRPSTKLELFSSSQTVSVST